MGITDQPRFASARLLARFMRRFGAVGDFDVDCGKIAGRWSRRGTLDIVADRLGRVPRSDS